MPAEILRTTWVRPTLMIVGETIPTTTDATAGIWNLGNNFLYLSDDNRSDVQIGLERIEYKKRMINGRMRSYYVADKKSFSVSWQDLPTSYTAISEYRSPIGSHNKLGSAKEILNWYEDHTGSFYLSLVYDNNESSESVPLKYRLEYYNVFFESFNYNIRRRGAQHDFWDISMTLVEV